MPNSKRIAGIVGPTIVAMVVSEFPLVQPHLYDAQIPPVVYLSGVLMFVGGLAIVRAHNHWALDWSVLVTLSGWFFLLLGLFRMFARASTNGAPRTHPRPCSWSWKASSWLLGSLSPSRRTAPMIRSCSWRPCRSAPRPAACAGSPGVNHLHP